MQLPGASAEVVMIVALALVLALVLVPAADSATLKFISSSGKWESPANWNLGRLPTVNDDVVIPPVFSVSIAGDTMVRSIQLNQFSRISGNDTKCRLTTINYYSLNSTTFDGQLALTVTGLAHFSGASSTPVFNQRPGTINVFNDVLFDDAMQFQFAFPTTFQFGGQVVCGAGSWVMFPQNMILQFVQNSLVIRSGAILQLSSQLVMITVNGTIDGRFTVNAGNSPQTLAGLQFDGRGIVQLGYLAVAENIRLDGPSLEFIPSSAAQTTFSITAPISVGQVSLSGVLNVVARKADDVVRFGALVTSTFASLGISTATKVTINALSAVGWTFVALTGLCTIEVANKFTGSSGILNLGAQITLVTAKTCDFSIFSSSSLGGLQINGDGIFRPLGLLEITSGFLDVHSRLDFSATPVIHIPKAGIFRVSRGVTLETAQFKLEDGLIQLFGGTDPSKAILVRSSTIINGNGTLQLFGGVTLLPNLEVNTNVDFLSGLHNIFGPVRLKTVRTKPTSPTSKDSANIFIDEVLNTEYLELGLLGSIQSLSRGERVTINAVNGIAQQPGLLTLTRVDIRGTSFTFDRPRTRSSQDEMAINLAESSSIAVTGALQFGTESFVGTPYGIRIKSDAQVAPWARVSGAGTPPAVLASTGIINVCYGGPAPPDPRNLFKIVTTPSTC